MFHIFLIPKKLVGIDKYLMNMFILYYTPYHYKMSHLVSFSIFV